MGSKLSVTVENSSNFDEVKVTVHEETRSLGFNHSTEFLLPSSTKRGSGSVRVYNAVGLLIRETDFQFTKIADEQKWSVTDEGVSYRYFNRMYAASGMMSAQTIPWKYVKDS